MVTFFFLLKTWLTPYICTYISVYESNNGREKTKGELWFSEDIWMCGHSTQEAHWNRNRSQGEPVPRAGSARKKSRKPSNSLGWTGALWAKSKTKKKKRLGLQQLHYVPEEMRGYLLLHTRFCVGRRGEA